MSVCRSITCGLAACSMGGLVFTCIMLGIFGNGGSIGNVFLIERFVNRAGVKSLSTVVGLSAHLPGCRVGTRWGGTLGAGCMRARRTSSSGLSVFAVPAAYSRVTWAGVNLLRFAVGSLSITWAASTVVTGPLVGSTVGTPVRLCCSIERSYAERCSSLI